MRLNRFVRVSVVGLTCLSMIAPTRCLAARPFASSTGAPVTHARTTTTDVRLTERSEFTGQVRNREGQPLIGDTVHLLRDGRIVSETTTRFDGGFEFHGVRPGVYHLMAAGQIGTYRVWSASVAPPVAKNGVLIVGGDVLRGQRPGVGHGLYDGTFMHVLSNPWIVTGLLAAGIAIPIAIANDDDSDGS